MGLRIFNKDIGKSLICNSAKKFITWVSAKMPTQTTAHLCAALGQIYFTHTLTS
jgi:hypothetical protein